MPRNGEENRSVQQVGKIVAIVRVLPKVISIDDKAFAECKADSSWQTFTADSGHDVMVDAPEWLADVLMKVG